MRRLFERVHISGTSEVTVDSLGVSTDSMATEDPLGGWPETTFSEVNETENTTESSFADVDILDQYWQYRLAMRIDKYSPPVIFTIGTTFNILCLCVLLRHNMRTRSTFVYLAGLTIADTVFLFCNPLRMWVRAIRDYRILHEELWACKTVSFVSYTASHFSVWVLVLVTFERLFVIVSPLKGPLWCRRSRAFFAMGILLLLVVGLNLHVLWTFDQVTTIYGPKCAHPDAYEKFGSYWAWMDTSVYSLLPSVIILIMNIVIIVRTVGAQKVRRAMSVAQTGNCKSAGNTEDHKRLTIMLLTLSFAFILTTAPISVFTILVNVNDYSHVSPSKDAELILGQQVCRKFTWINHGMNFFLYCITGKKFRRELFTMLSCHQLALTNRLRKNPDNTSMSTLSGSIHSKSGVYSMQPLPNKSGRNNGLPPLKNGKGNNRGSIVNSSVATKAEKENGVDDSDVVLTGFRDRTEADSRA